MLARVRQALGRPGEGARSAGETWPALENVLPPIPPGELLDRFEAELAAVAGSCHRAGSTAELKDLLARILPPPATGPVVLSRNPLLARLDIGRTLESLNYAVTGWPSGADLPVADRDQFRSQCFAASAGFTGIDFALAESGTLVLTSATEGSQLASLAPPVHVALYTRDQVVESLEEVLRRLGLSGVAGREPTGRSVVFVTGPSRTSDIEQVSIRGVHGPTQVHAILVEDAAGRDTLRHGKSQG